MKIRSYETGVICAIAFLLIGTAAFAQTTTSSKPASQTSSASAATGRKSGSVIAADRDASSGMSTGRREANTGQASGRQDQFPKASGAITEQPGAGAQSNARNSAHAVESLSASQPAGSSDKKLANAQSNPLYQPKGTAGENPLFEPKSKTAAKPGSAAPAPVEYKDGEDQTTRYRPGNNKTH
jgi:hypothetical protein